MLHLAVVQCCCLSVLRRRRPRRVLAAAGRHAIAGVSHDLLVAAFERVDAGISSWQLTTVQEEASSSWLQEDGMTEPAGQTLQGCGQGCTAGKVEQDDEVPVDQTFITGEFLLVPSGLQAPLP